MVSPVTPGEGWTGSDPEVWRLPPEDLSPDIKSPSRRPRRRPPAKRSARNRELHVLGWNTGTAEPPTAWDKEPLLTIKKSPKVFLFGVPLVLAVGLIIVLALRTFDMRTAMFVSLVVQAVGFVGIYSMAQRRRADPLKKHLPGSDLRPM